MRIGVNALCLKEGEFSGVHRAVRGLLRSVHEAMGEGDKLTLYLQRAFPAGVPPVSEMVRHIHPWWPVASRTGRITWEQFVLYRRVFGDGLDLLHCPVYVMPRFCLKPAVISVHDAFALRRPELCTAANFSHYRRMLPASLVRAARVVVPSEHVRRELLAWNEGRREPIAGLNGKIRVIPWGVDAAFGPVASAERREEVALRYGLPPRFVLWAGRMEPKKNLRRVVEAYFAATAARQLPHRLVLIGPKGWGVVRETEKLIRELGLGAKVVRPGFVAEEDLPAVYAMADCLLFPSTAEGFGFPVLEAMACGTPVVCGDIPALRETGGDAAAYVAPEDLPALREALEAVLTDEARRAGMIEKGSRQAELFPWEKHARQTLALYEEVIGEDRSRLQG